MTDEQPWPTRQPRPRLIRPASATHDIVAVVAGLSIMGSFFYIRLRDPFHDTVDRMLFMCGVTAILVFSTDWAMRLRKRPRPQRLPAKGDLTRSGVKFLGWLVTLASVSVPYLLFAEYRGDFYDRYFHALGEIALPVLLLAFPYIYLVDRRMARPQDGNWAVGMMALLQFDRVDRGVLRQHFLGWIVKGFFLPLMFLYSCGNLDSFLDYDVMKLKGGFQPLYDIMFDFLYFIDVVIAVVGYTCSLRLFDSHIRSVEPTTTGWVIALICYVPFWPLFANSYIQYDTGHGWADWLKDWPIVSIVWGLLILALTAIYVWATLAFGGRFSNLTHRGIITSGPYRWTKHPAYVAKNLSWWLVALPFIGTDLAVCLRATCCLALLNGIYFLRARTEERHLSLDPVYRDYAAWIARHGVLRWIRLKLPEPLDPQTLRKHALVYATLETDPGDVAKN